MGKSDKQAMQAILGSLPAERVYQRTAVGRGSKNHANRAADYANYEDALVNAIDMKRDIELVAKIFKKIDDGTIDVTGLFHGTSPVVAKKLLYIALNGESEKNRLDALKHLLALAGHSPAQKHEISRVDPSTPKEALLSLIAGQMRELKDEGIEVEDDRGEDKPEGT